jgi:hypothetical protein
VVPDACTEVEARLDRVPRLGRADSVALSAAPFVPVEPPIVITRC